MDDRRETRIEIYSGWMTEETQDIEIYSGWMTGETQELKYIVDG